MEASAKRAEAPDWRDGVADELDALDLAFIEAVVEDVAGADPVEALRVSGLALTHYGHACDWLLARMGEHDRRRRELRPYRNLPLDKRRVLDRAPSELASESELRDALARHHRKLPDLEATAVGAYVAASHAAEATNTSPTRG